MDKVHTITRRRAVLVGALVSSAVLAVPVAAAVSGETSPMAALFAEWSAIRERNSLDEAEGLVAFARYLELREQMLALEPLTPADLARQFLAETDGGESDYRDDYLARMLKLAEG